MMERTAGDRSLISRMVGAAQLNDAVYEDIERDVDATGQAAIVVAIVAVCSGIGQLRDGGIAGLVLAIIAAFVGWVVWAAVTYWVGKTFFKTPNTEVTLGQMLRTLGFAQSPGVLRILGFIPVLGPLISLVAGIWVLVTGIVAIRTAMDFSTGRAIGTAIVGWIILVVITAILAFIGISLS
jgi:hypothetical protein